jgi:cysteine desulfurase
MKRQIYLDNNSTTHLPNIVKNKVLKAFDYGNASSHYSHKAKNIITQFEDTLYKHLDLPRKDYTLVFTSGASESNATIITTCALSFKERTGITPHIITSNAEHKSILKTCQNLVRNGIIECSLITINAYGYVNPEDLNKLIKDNTCLVTIMTANNEIGSINNIEELASICHKRKVPFHTDAVQAWGKIKFKPSKQNIDAFSLSFHKVYGPIGIGLLGIRNIFIEGYQLSGLIGGTQNKELRGGTINVPAMAGACAGVEWFFHNRAEKNKKLHELYIELINGLREYIPVTRYPDSTNRKIPPIEILLFGPEPGKANTQMSHTILMSVVNREKPICNLKLRDDLLNYKGAKYFVSIGSACNTESKKPSHVLFAMGLPKELRCGVLRISIGDTNTVSEIRSFVAALIECIQHQMS